MIQRADHWTLEGVISERHPPDTNSPHLTLHSTLAQVNPVEGIEPAEGRGHVPAAEAEVPLAHQVGGVPEVIQPLREQLQAQRHGAVVDGF